MITYMHIAQELPKYGLKPYYIALQFTCNCTSQYVLYFVYTVEWKNGLC